MRKTKIKNVLCAMLTANLILGLAGCGEIADKLDKVVNQDNEATTVDVSELVSGNATKDIDSALGEWEIIAYRYETGLSFAEDDYYSGEVNLYKEDGQYKADWCYYSEGSTEIYGRKLEIEDGALYGNCDNQKWFAHFYHKEYEDSTRDMSLTMADMDTLEVLVTNVYTFQDELGNTQKETYNTLYYLRKKGTDYSQFENSLRYTEVIEVSTVKEFYNSLGSNRIIKLKAGTYNFSELPEADRDNPNVNWIYDYYMYDDYEKHYITDNQAYLYDVDNLIIEGEEGADVHICTNDSWVAPLAFGDCTHITLRNLRVGHNAEKGICAGSVLYYNSCQKVNIENCRLYGCGTYGVWAEYTNTMDVKDTDIYECSYGIMRLSSCWDATFDNCVMRDSSDMSMFDYDCCSDIYIKNSIIKNNNSMYDVDPFIRANECYGDIVFENCTFDNNSYITYTEGEVTFK